jgi:hypothetical protein
MAAKTGAKIFTWLDVVRQPAPHKLQHIADPEAWLGGLPLRAIGVRSQGPEERLPPFRVAPEEDALGEPVPGHVLRRHRVPAEMLDGHARALPHRLEAHVHVGLLAGGEAGLAPREDEQRGRLPDPDPPDLEGLAALEGLGQPPALPGFEGQLARAAGGELEEEAATPSTLFPNPL